jgi:hypothetical protein
MSNLGKAVSVGRNLAKQEGKTGAAAAVSGLGKALAATVAQMPTSAIKAVKGKGGQQGEHVPGMFSRAKHDLRERAAGGGASAGLSNSPVLGAGARLGSTALGGNGRGAPGGTNGRDQSGAVGKSKASSGSASSQSESASAAASLSSSDLKGFYAPDSKSEKGGAGSQGDIASKPQMGHTNANGASNSGTPTEFFAPKTNRSADLAVEAELDPPPPYSPPPGQGAKGL